MAKGQHKSDKEQYAAYAAGLKRIKNRAARLARHLKKHPEDVQAVTAAGHDGKQKQDAAVKGHYPSKRFYLYDGAGMKTLLNTVEPTIRGKK